MAESATALKAGCEEGWAYAQKGDYDRAIQDYDQALRIKPTYVLALNNRRLAYARKGDYLRAMIDNIHFMWLKFGFWGNVIRLSILALSLAVLFGSIFKRYRRDHPMGQEPDAGIFHPRN